MRARNIKPGFYKNADLAECSVMSRLLFPGLWMLADREGRLEDRPKQIKGEIFPFDEADVNALLDELSVAGMLLRYVNNGKKYIQILNFSKHQRPHANETKSEIPAFSETCAKVESTCHQGDKHFALNDITLMLNPSSLNAECNDASNDANAIPRRDDLFGNQVDFKKVLFTEGLKMLGGDKARPLLGKWLKDYGEPAVIAAMLETQKQSAVEPKGYMEKILRNGKGNQNGQAHLNFTPKPPAKQGWADAGREYAERVMREASERGGEA